MSTLTAQQYQAQLEELRQKKARTQTEFDRAALAALADPASEPLRARLRRELVAIEEHIADLAAARRAAMTRQAARSSEEARAAARAAVATARDQAAIVQRVASEIDVTLAKLFDLLHEGEAANVAMIRAVFSAAQRSPMKSMELSGMIDLSGYQRSIHATVLTLANRTRRGDSVERAVPGVLARIESELLTETDEAAA